jgi:hypothetical protein
MVCCSRGVSRLRRNDDTLSSSQFGSPFIHYYEAHVALKKVFLSPVMVIECRCSINSSPPNMIVLNVEQSQFFFVVLFNRYYPHSLQLLLKFVLRLLPTSNVF